MNDECSVDCLMCQTKRPRHLSPNTRKSETTAVWRQHADVSNNDVPEKKSLRQQNNTDGDKKEPAKEVKPNASGHDSISIQPSESNNRQEKVSVKHESNSKWDAFASLEKNYESSDSGEDESDSDSDGSDASENFYEDDKEEYNQHDGGNVGADQSQWNAFKSLEATLGDDSSSSSGSSSGEESDCILIEDGQEKKMASSKTPSKNNYESECVDLVDTDDDDEDVQKEKNTMPKRVNSRRKRKRASDPSAITLLDDDSDSSYLSEVESSRPLQPSPATRQMRTIPPWQRASRQKTKSTSILQNDRVLPRESFSLLSSRNDVSGSGLNETRTSAPAARQPKQRKTSTKSSTSTKSGSRRRKRSNSDGAEPAKKKRRTRKYRRSSKRGGRGGRGGTAASRNNNPWSARERGIRQPIRDNSGSGSYMNITKQEPILRNIGGASIQF